MTTLFDHASLRADVLKVLAEADVPADHKVAVLVAADMTGAAQVVVAVRAGDHWTLDLGVAVAKDRAPTGGVLLKGSW